MAFWFMSFSAFVVFWILLLSTCVPYTFLRNCCVNASKFTISLLGCASCGVFIATCFLGLVPHVRHQEMELRSNVTIIASYTFVPSTDQLVIIGFLIILILEQIIHGIGNSISSRSHSSHTSLPTTSNNIKLRKFMDESGEDVEPLVEVDSMLDNDNDIDNDDDEIIFRRAPNSPARSNGSSDEGPHHRNSATMNIRVWFLLLGMSVHSFFEGVALGVQNDKKAFYQILIAVMFHEVLCCVSYGVQLAKHNASRKYAWTSSLFLSATIPLGMVLATTIDGIENEMWQRLGRYWLEGLAAGTFVHVALVELLPMELHSDDDGSGGGHGHSHSVISDTPPSHSNGHVHGHSHGAEAGSNWTSLVKSLFVAGGVATFVLIKSAIGDHH